MQYQLIPLKTQHSKILPPDHSTLNSFNYLKEPKRTEEAPQSWGGRNRSRALREEEKHFLTVKWELHNRLLNLGGWHMPLVPQGSYAPGNAIFRLYF